VRPRALRQRALPRAVVLAALALCGPALLAACSNPGVIGKPTVTTVASAPSSAVDTLRVKGYGTILVTASGHPLYVLSSDPKDGTNCTGGCSNVWPPLEVVGTIKAGPGVDAALLSSFERPGGAHQVLYAGHALYTYSLDTASGQVEGEGVHSYGGTWSVISPSGKPVTHASGD